MILQKAVDLFMVHSIAIYTLQTQYKQFSSMRLFIAEKNSSKTDSATVLSIEGIDKQLLNLKILTSLW